jgi:hypothetical protein
MNPKSSSLHLVLIIVLVFLLACSSSQPQYKEARRIDTIAAYQKFLSNHPSSEYAKTAKTRIEEINFEKAKGVNSVSAYQGFISTSNSELFKNYANQLIEKIYTHEFQKTKAIDTLDAYEEYIAKYPKSTYLEDCSIRIDALMWNKTIKENNALMYYNYVYSCDVCGRHDQEAKNRLKKAIKLGRVIDYVLTKKRVEKILNRSDIVVVQRGSNGISTQSGSMRLEELRDAEEVLVRIVMGEQTISSVDLAKGNYESVKKLRLKHRVPGNSLNTIGYSTIIIYAEKDGPTEVIFIADGKGYLFQDTGSSIY